MATLVVGPYPPSADPVAAVVLGHVRELRRSGDLCDVVSPAPSAARHHADLARPKGVLALARLTRGHDRVVVHYTGDLVPAPAPDPVRRIMLAAWRRALEGVRNIEVVLHRFDASDDGAVLTLLAARSAHFAVPDAALLAKLESRCPGLPAPRVDSRFAPVGGVAPTGASWPDDVHALQGEVVARAAIERTDRQGAELRRLRASSPVRVSLPTSTRPGLTTVRRLLQRLTAWEMDPLVGQVNRLRGAVLDALGTPGPRTAEVDPSSSGTAARTEARNAAPSTDQS
jgi:hypothetical protein